MMKMRRLGNITTILSLFAAFLLVAALPVHAKTSVQKTAPAKKTKKKKVVPPPLNIQGFHTGMTVKDVKQLLRKKRITGYETAFSDLFVYDPLPGTEVKLLFTCSPKGSVLGTAELRLTFANDETDAALPKFKEQLVAKYGMPSITDSQWDRLDYCWGQCDEGANGLKLNAKTTAPQEGKRSLVLVLANERLVQACGDQRREKINAWLYQWIAAVQKFKPGMALKDASLLYQERYWEKMKLEEERDEASRQFAVSHYVLKGHDFLTALDPASLMFEGQGLGAITLKFTGDQAGRDSTLNNRLYYSFFSTTSFKNLMLGSDLSRKFDLFRKAYGNPSDLSEQPGKILAVWDNGKVRRELELNDTGLVTFEQSDLSLKDAYGEAAVKKISEYGKTRFDKPNF